MFNIIGADGKQYGPVSGEQVRQWIREGRANGASQVQSVGATEWKSLAGLPEFADVFGSGTGAPPSMTPPPVNVASRASNKIAAGICGILLGGLGVHKFILGYTQAGLIMLLVSILTCGIGYVVMHVIGLIEGIIYLTKSDEEFVRLYVDGRKEWF
jgi:TM2 domain-containing membrane protein YozV